jgi:hypothetical protein
MNLEEYEEANQPYGCLGGYNDTIVSECHDCEDKLRCISEPERRKLLSKPKIITLCGSTGIQDAIMKYAWELTKKGHMVLFAPFRKEDNPEIEKYREVLEKIHFKKIDISDEVHIMVKDGHIGEHTRLELEYAKSKNKKIEFIGVE